MVVSIAAYAGTFFARGFFAGHRRFGLYSAVLLSDACTRILFPLAVAVGIARAPPLSRSGSSRVRWSASRWRRWSS